MSLTPEMIPINFPVDWKKGTVCKKKQEPGSHETIDMKWRKYEIYDPNQIWIRANQGEIIYNAMFELQGGRNQKLFEWTWGFVSICVFPESRLKLKRLTDVTVIIMIVEFAIYRRWRNT